MEEIYGWRYSAGLGAGCSWSKILNTAILKCIVQPQLPPLPQEHIDNLWMGENRLRQIILPVAAAVRYPSATIIYTTPVAVVLLCY